MIIVQEDYLVRCLDSGVYQTRVVVMIGEATFSYQHDTRLWSEHYLTELRNMERMAARRHIMRCIEKALFQE